MLAGPRARPSRSLFCPHECPFLHERVGDEFKELYEKYERENRARKVRGPPRAAAALGGRTIPDPLVDVSGAARALLGGRPRCTQTIKAQTLWYAILDAQVETGTPYMMYKGKRQRLGQPLVEPRRAMG